MPTNTNGGTTTSFANTPQAKDDVYLYTEEQLLCAPSIYNKATRTLSLNVMSNDLGGNAKNLYSIDDGGTGAMNDLLQSNVTTAWEQTADGNWIRINAGVIEYRIDNGSHSYANARDVNSLNEGETINDSFVYAIRLGNGTLSWATVNITLTGSNDLATITGATTGGVTEDGDGITTFQTVSGALTIIDPDSGQDEVQPIAAGTSGDNGHGTFEVLADGTWTYTLNNGAPAIQELSEGETTTDTITVTSEDGTDTEVITVTITGTNDVPTVTNVGTAADEDGASVTAGFAGDDIDSDDNAASLAYALTSSPSEGSVVNNGDGTFTFDPGSDFQDLAEGETRAVTFNYTATDSHGATSNSGTVTVTVTGTNDAPTVTDVGTAADEDGSSVTASFSGDDVDSDDNAASLTYALTTSPSEGSVVNNGDGTFTFDPGSDFQDLAEGETREVTFDYTATDSHGAVSNTGTVTVTVTGTNDAPTLETAISDQSSDEDNAWNFTVPAGTFADVDNGTILTFTATLDNGDPLPAWLSFDPDTQTFSGTPPTDFNGSLDIKVTASDGTESVSDTFQLTIDPVNDAPTTSATNSVTTNEDTASAAVSIGATDIENDALTYSVKNTAQPAHGTVTFDQNAGTFTYTPNANYNGSDSFTIVIDDGNGGTTEQVVSVTVNPVNDPAVISGASSGSVTEDAVPNTVGGNLNSTDVDGVNDSWTAVTSATASTNGYGTYTIDAAGNWVYTLDNSNPAVNALNNGGTLSDSFTVTTADGTSQVVNITINGHTDVVVVTLPPTFTGTGDPNDFDNLGNPAGQNLSGTATNGNDTIYGGAGADIINGGGGDDTIYGGSGGDNLGGGNDGDHLYGGSGTDTISGGNNNDTIIGGYGADNLTGNNGNDTFVYLDVKDTNDTITDFASGDKIDLSAIDANSNLAGDQGFAFGGTTATANGVWYAQSGANVIVYVDTDGNASTAELAITLANTTTANLNQTDFLLGP